ncbi:GCN5 family acetyltransferase [Rhizobium sp. Root73]|uniref:GNAT family N-acetyltransferase n=1 Tax=Rhizobium sp. Root1204 TaxID=1736428 RepID=UPI0007139CD5|nr:MULTISPECIES: GNAT family N-acetyltransferase [unclassified Rhizobium]KQV39712.1 GCN5 family acetyltransferase [Rhizobium sp. Root1204]KQY01950.1 GCN5 family acetyltransferase [Rhizobium sp. Root1334]KRB97523.1 GCN5 family acetyltransferase [Rhizobium sp. Root73]
MTATLTIRPIESGDEQDWRRLWKAYLAFYETTLPEDIYALTFSRLLSGAAHEYAGFLAVLDGRPVGLAHYLFHRSCWQKNSICYLQDLFADPEVRGQGIGRALIEAVYARANAEKAEEVYWMTQDFNANARKLYDRIADKTPFIIYQKTF